nr:glutamine-rich protein 2 [Aotus nancymaae]
MPPATAVTTVSLRELADLSIGTPEVGAVNFTALHTLIVAMLKTLDLQNTQIDFQAPSPEPSRSLQSSRGSLSTPNLPEPKEAPKEALREKLRSVSRAPPLALESQVKDLGGQVEDLSKQLKRIDGQVQGIATHVQHFSQATGLHLAVPEWLEEQEVGVRGPDSVRTAEELSIARVLLQRVDELEKQLKDREQFLELVSRKLSLDPGVEEVTMVTWEELEQAITDGRRASQAGSETLMGFSKRRGFTSLTSPDASLSGVSTEQPSTDQALDSARGLGPDQTASRSSGTAHPSDGVTGREQSRAPAGAGRLQQPRARDEADMPQLHPSSTFQFKLDSDRQRSREKLTSTHPRRDEQDARPGPAQQDLTLASGQPSRVPTSQSQVRARPDRHGLEPTGTDQPGFMHAGTYPHLLLNMGQLGVPPPEMDDQELIPLVMDQKGMVPPSVPGRDQQGLELPSTDRHAMVPLSPYQPGMTLPGTDQRSMEPLVMDQHGFIISVTGQQGLVPPGMDQQGLVWPGIDQHGLVPPFTDQHGLVQPGAYPPGLVQPGAGQRGLVWPGMDQSGLVQPGTGQHGLVQSGAGQGGLVQPGVDQPGMVQPGTDRIDVVQFGAYPPDLVHPGMDQHGLVQPGTFPSGRIQPDDGVDEHGLAQLGADQPGLGQPGVDECGLAQPGADQPGLVQPGADQPGLVQPGAGQLGMVQPGIDQQGLMHPGTLINQRGPTPVTTGLESTLPNQQHLTSPGPGEHDQVHPVAAQRSRAFSLADSRDSTHPGSGGPRFLSADQHSQEGLDPSRTQASDEPGIPAQMAPGQDITLFRSPDSLGRVSSERSEVLSEVPSEHRDSLRRMSSSFPTAVETFRLMGELSGLYLELKESMKDLDEEETGQTEMEKIQILLAKTVKKIIPPDLQEQLNTVKTLAKEVWQEKAEVERLQRILEGEPGKELKAGDLSLQLGDLRVTVADIEKELAELRESQETGKATMENSVSEASLYLQDQLDKLRTIIESMLASSSTLLSMSMAPHQAYTLAPGQIDPEATCPACSLDVSHQVSTLVQRYEQLQDMVNRLVVSRPSKKAKLQRQDEELLGRVQSAILQVQGDCEKLNVTTSNLIEDHRQKQKDIAMLYQGLEKLEKEKANREHLEMEIDVKADKSALATKVSRIQFDATTEQLNHMMQELVAKMSAQEQDWQKILEKLLTEMDTKLDRLELDPLKQLLEDRWKSLRQQLRERPPLYQADEAAAMRRQLLAHFHCLSCDRPLETTVTGQAIPVTPAGPGLPGHCSIRPYTVFELEQVRQHSRNLKLGTAFPRGDLAQMEQSVRRLRSMHSKMLMNIEKVQIHFGGSTKASSQVIRELLQAQCLSSPCYKRVTDTANYSYSTVPRSCGGSHTLTYPYHHSRLQHLPRGLYPTEEIQIAMKHDEVDILGLDGHIYKGRMDTRLPGILSKDSSGTSKRKSRQPRPNVHRQPSLSASGQLPSRPQSAQMSAGNTPVFLLQQKDRPSSDGRLPPLNTTHPLSPAEVANGGPERHMDVLPGEGLEEPTAGPQSTNA